MRRSKDQLIALILTACLGDGAIKTKIVYHTNLNFRTVQPYLDLLADKGLLEGGNGRAALYKTTPKGERALECLREIDAIYS